MGTEVMTVCFVFHRPCCLPLARVPTHTDTSSLVSDTQQKMLREFPVSCKCNKIGRNWGQLFSVPEQQWTRYLEAQKGSSCSWWEKDRTELAGGTHGLGHTESEAVSRLLALYVWCVPRRQHGQTSSHSRRQKDISKGKWWVNIVPWELAQLGFWEEWEGSGYLSPLPKRGSQEEEFPLSDIQGTTKGKGGIFIDIRMMRTNVLHRI